MKDLNSVHLKLKFSIRAVHCQGFFSSPQDVSGCRRRAAREGLALPRCLSPSCNWRFCSWGVVVYWINKIKVHHSHPHPTPLSSGEAWTFSLILFLWAAHPRACAVGSPCPQARWPWHAHCWAYGRAPCSGSKHCFQPSLCSTYYTAIFTWDPKKAPHCKLI